MYKTLGGLAFPVMNHIEIDWDLLAETPTFQKFTVKCVRKEIHVCSDIALF